MQIYKKDRQIKEIDKEFNAFMLTYQRTFQEPVKNRFFRYERDLWIYFLAEPKKVLECIKEVQRKAAAVNSSSFKALNIQLPKANRD